MIAILAMWLLGKQIDFTAIPPEVGGAITGLLTAAVAGIVGGIGKVLRDGKNVLGKFF